MTNVSKTPLNYKLKQKLFKEFAGLFSSHSEQKIARLFLELFTEAEQIMFIKRVGIILLLQKQCSNYFIAQTLQVSQTTVATTQDRFIAGEYSNIIMVTKRSNFDIKKFWKAMDVLLSAGLPSKTDRNRWSKVFGTHYSS